MRRVEMTEVIFSSLFFLLAVFTLLVVGLSSWTENFAQLFALVSKNRGLYVSLFQVWLGVGIIASIFFLFIRPSRPPLARKYRFSMGVMLAIFSATLFFSVVGRDVSLEQGVLSWVHHSAWLIWLDSYAGTRLLDGLFFMMFVGLPLGMWLGGVEFDREDRLGRFLHALRPSVNLAIATLFALAIQPVVKESWWHYGELVVLWSGIGLLGALYYRRRYYFGFYESFNLMLLILGVALLALAHPVFDGYVNYYEAKKSFYGLILLGWSVRWMERLTR